MTVISILLRASALMMVMYGIHAVFARRLSATMRHLIWTFAIMGLLLLPALTSVLPGWTAIEVSPRRLSETAPAIELNPVSSPVVMAPAIDRESPCGTHQSGRRAIDSLVGRAGNALCRRRTCGAGSRDTRTALPSAARAWGIGRGRSRMDETVTRVRGDSGNSARDPVASRLESDHADDVRDQAAGHRHSCGR